MFKSSDPYTHTAYGNLFVKTNGTEEPYGLLTAIYEVTHYDDLQITRDKSDDRKNRQYIVTCTVRATILNPEGITLAPQENLVAYKDYPALLETTTRIVKSEDNVGLDIQLLNYSPLTVNTQVQTTGSQGASDGTNTTNSKSRTSGSSMSQSSSYSANAGVTGDIFSFGVSHDHSRTSTTDNSATSSADYGRNSSQDNSSSASMSIMDWGVYNYVDPANNCVGWSFAQEYPWDVLQCRSTDNDTPNADGQVTLQVPTSAIAALYDGDIVYPPSHLSMFGASFATQMQSKIIIDDLESDHVVTFEHDLFLYLASHGLLGNDSKTCTVTMDNKAYILQTSEALAQKDDVAGLTTKLDLSLMALDPIEGGGGPAVTGFLPNKFTVVPVQPIGDKYDVRFSIFSDSNNLLVKDTTDYGKVMVAGSTSDGDGFSASSRALFATLSPGCPSLSFTVFFKITDTIADYSLYLKHWKTENEDIKLQITINGDKGSRVEKLVSAFEAEGGEGNLLTLTLRNQNFSSVEYEDYLKLGLNSIEITVSSADSSQEGSYALRAISIEPN